MSTNTRSTFPAPTRGTMQRPSAHMADRWSFPSPAPTQISAAVAARGSVAPRGAVAGRVYRRRRLAVIGVVVGLVLLLLVGGYGIAGADSAGPARMGSSAGTPGAPGASGLSAHVHVVRPGDTLWSIARSVQPSGDVRPLVERLSQQTGARLDVGMRVELPG